jgi:hypothetical protein
MIRRDHFAAPVNATRPKQAVARCARRSAPSRVVRSDPRRALDHGQQNVASVRMGCLYRQGPAILAAKVRPHSAHIVDVA